MKRYKLLKDLPGIKAGTVFRTGNQVYNELYDDNNGRATGYRLLPNGDISGEVPLLCSPVNEWFEEIPEEYKRWRAELYGYYYWLTEDLGVVEEVEDGGAVDEKLHAIGNYFQTPEAAEEAADWFKALAVLRDDTKGFKPDWQDPDQKVWVVRYDRGGGKLITDYFFQWDFGSVIHFATKEDAKASIKNHKREWLTFFGVEE